MATCLLVAGHAVAEVRFTPGVSARARWTDNLFMKDNADFEYLVKPTAEFIYSADRSSIQGNADVARYMYADQNQYDRTEYTVNAKGAHKFSERLSAELSGGWVSDYSIDDYRDSTGVLQNNVRRDTYTVAPTIIYQLTELDTLTLSLNYADATYAETSFANYTMAAASLFWQHYLVEGTVALQGQANWQNFSFDEPEATYQSGFIPFLGTEYNINRHTVQNVYNAMFGIYWLPISRLSIQVLVGGNYTQSAVTSKTDSTQYSFGSIAGTDSTKETKHYNNTGFSGQANIQWQLETGNLRLVARQSHVPSIYGEIKVVNSLSLNAHKRFSDRLSGNLALYYSNSKTDDTSGANRLKKNYYLLSGSGTYKLLEDFAMQLRYAYEHGNDKINDDKDRANSLTLQFTYALPMQF